ncbi:MAG: metallophosphoesterase [Sedimentisphaerales bacterium]|nr:metallophosphoesterase [Sedimentisphaerales bacterium]
MKRHCKHWVVVIAVCAVFAPRATAQEAEKLAVAHGPYLQAVTETSATVVWVTNKNCVSHIHYGAEGISSDSNDATTAFASHDGLIDANTKLHKIVLTSLKPGRTYDYRIVSKEIVKFDPYEVTYGDTVTAGPYRLHTCNPQKEQFSFCVVNDIHEQAERLASLLSMVAWDATDLVFLNGDMIDHWTRENQVFDGFLDVCVRRFAREIPFVYVRGNHETRGALARDLIEYFPTPNGRYYFAFRHGPVSFLVLDSGEDKPDANKEYSGLVDFDAYRAEETKWLRQTVQDDLFQTSRYRIVLVHMPPFADERAYGQSQIYRSWVPILNRADIDLMLCGHTHQFARIDPNELAHHFPILINAPDMIVNVAVSESSLAVVVKQVDGRVVDVFALKPDSPN